jgi:hypothetical protein
MTTARTAYLAVALIAGGVLGSTPALADNAWKQSSSVWRVMDRCTRAAQKRFPDHTADAIAKREADRRQCFRASNLPGDVDPPQPAAEQR